MTRTASCFFALGIGIALAAACGDDDGGDGVGGAGGGGGSGGAGASGGAAGSGGDAGSGAAGTGGTGAGTGGDGGDANGGSSGSSAGTAGSSAGTAGTSSGGAGSVEEGDAGPDGSVEGDAGPDSSVAGSAGTGGTGSGPVDSGINGDCANFATAAAAINAQTNQQIVISRVIFNTANDTAIVALRAVDAAFNFAPTQKLCSGTTAAEDASCVDIQTLVDDGDLPDELALNTEVTVTVEGVFPEGGEIVLGSNFASEPLAFTFAYIAWGADFVGDTPTAGGGDAWETRAVDDDFWLAAERVDPDGAQNALILGGNPGDATNNGNSSLAAGFGVCTADQFF